VSRLANKYSIISPGLAPGGSEHNLGVNEAAPEAFGDAYKVTIMSQTDVH